MSQIYCSNCGQVINGNSNFCKFCGAPQHGKEAMFRWQDPVVEKPQAVTHIPKQAQRQDVEFIKKQHLGSDAVWFFFFAFFGKSFLLFFLLLAGVAMASYVGASGLILLMVIALVAYFVGLFVTTFLVYNNFTYEVDKYGLKIEQGVIHRYHVSVPYEQIQNVNIERTIIDRLLGLSRVSIETAGQASTPSNYKQNVTKGRSEAYLPGLHLKDAERIHDLLIDGADGVHGN